MVVFQEAILLSGIQLGCDQAFHSSRTWDPMRSLLLLARLGELALVAEVEHHELVRSGIA